MRLAFLHRRAPRFGAGSLEGWFKGRPSYRSAKGSAAEKRKLRENKREKHSARCARGADSPPWAGS